MLTPKAFSIRSAISGDSAALPFSRSDSVARRTPRIAAAYVTFRPNSSITSKRTNSPGWEGVMFMPSRGDSAMFSPGKVNGFPPSRE